MNSQQLSGAAVPNKNSHAVPGTRVAISLAIAAMLSACSLVPGQHMITPAALPVTTADNGDVTSDMQIPIKQIDLTLIRQIHAEQKNNTMAQSQLNLFAKPSGYKLGSGDVLQIVVWDHPELAAALGQPAQNTRPTDAAPGFVVQHQTLFRRAVSGRTVFRASLHAASDCAEDRRAAKNTPVVAIDVVGC